MKRFPEKGPYNLKLKTNQNNEATVKNWIVQDETKRVGELITVFKDGGLLEEKDE